MSYNCEQCSATFESNFGLYNHKVKDHPPIVGIVTKNASDEPKFNKINDDPERKKRYRSRGNDGNPSKYRKVYESDEDNRGVKRLHSSSDDSFKRAISSSVLISNRVIYHQYVRIII